jgi:hypothetical protein
MKDIVLKKMQTMTDDDVRVFMSCLHPNSDAYLRLKRKLIRNQRPKKDREPMLFWPAKDQDDEYEGLTFVADDEFKRTR